MNAWNAALVTSSRSSQKPRVIVTPCAGCSLGSSARTQSGTVIGSARGAASCLSVEPIVNEPRGTQTWTIPRASVRLVPAAAEASAPRVGWGRWEGCVVGVVEVPAVVPGCVVGLVASGSLEPMGVAHPAIVAMASASPVASRRVGLQIIHGYYPRRALKVPRTVSASGPAPQSSAALGSDAPRAGAP